MTSRTADPCSVLATKTSSGSGLLSGSCTPGVLEKQGNGFSSSEQQSGRFKGLLSRNHRSVFSSANDRLERAQFSHEY